MWSRPKKPARVVGAREPPELHAVGAESDFDAFGGKAGKVGTGLDADAVEEGEEVLGRREDRDGVWGEEVAVGAGADDKERAEGPGPRA